MVLDRERSSFRDPGGFVYFRDGELYRQINRSYGETWNDVVNSGLYDSLRAAGAIVPYEQIELDLRADDDAVAVIKPKRLDFISYPYEWSFSRLKVAALHTLMIQREALNQGFSLRDATAYNIQFERGKPIHIDSLSFERRKPSSPWIAYGQFCRHFLAPLALQSCVDVSFGKMMQNHLDGYPLPFASRCLPSASRLNFGLLAHLHFHAKATVSPRNAARNSARKVQVSSEAILGIVDSLERTILKLKPPNRPSEWLDYYEDNSYDSEAFIRKQDIVRQMLTQIGVRAKSVWDMGANTGVFSEIAAQLGAKVIAWDSDPNAVDAAFKKWSPNQHGIEALVQDFSNPSPRLGWAESERKSFGDRRGADVVMALALIHHLAISNQVPFGNVASWLGSLGRECVIEFVPKEDLQVQRLLQAREDIFVAYTEAEFEREFEGVFDLVERVPISGTGRIIYWWRRK
ncbi:MAG: SAM-dependent methyltransferase [Fimbriimonadaceae bacterium]